MRMTLMMNGLCPLFEEIQKLYDTINIFTNNNNTISEFIPFTLRFLTFEKRTTSHWRAMSQIKVIIITALRVYIE